MALHRNLAEGDIHVPYNWTFADAVARESATGLVLSDEGKLARQLDDDSLWMLTAADTGAWVAVGGGGSTAGVEPGYIFMSGQATPAGCLPCDGSLLAVASYPALYDAIGDTWSNPGDALTVNGNPWVNQYEFNVSQTGAIASWVTSGSALPIGMSYFPTAVIKGFLYTFGGFTTVGIDTIYRATINADGTLGGFASVGALPAARWGGGLLITSAQAYYIGGLDSSNNAVDTVYRAPINTDGTLGAWVSDLSLPAVRGRFGYCVTRGRIYVLGGFINGANTTDSVYAAPINPDGTIGAWTTETALPQSRANQSLVVTQDRVYLCGGRDDSAEAYDTVYTASFGADGILGTWSLSGSLPVPRSHQFMAVTRERVFLAGGWDGTNGVSTVFSAPVNTDGTIGTWAADASLPGDRREGGIAVVNNRVYLMGGYIMSPSGVTSSIDEASFAGGANDYTAEVVSPDGQFRLPDYSGAMIGSEAAYYYIKT